MKPCFLISHKYYRGHESYLVYYINNIQKFYKDSLIIIVDNNSAYSDDIFNLLPNNEKIIKLINEDECKFEIGAYKVGLKYLYDNNLQLEYDIFIFSQDTFILKNYYDFNNLKGNATSLVSYKNDWCKHDVCEKVLRSIELYDNLEYSLICWCNSFILTKNVLDQFKNYIKDIVIVMRYESEASERYLGKILTTLNGGINYDIDGDIDNLPYYCHTVNPYDDITSIFVKKAQQKNERTIDS